jgi:hypothetical protein
MLLIESFYVDWHQTWRSGKNRQVKNLANINRYTVGHIVLLCINWSSFAWFYLDASFSGLNRDCCMTKMRQLTLASMAAESEVLPFASLREELQLSQDQLEAFILDCEFLEENERSGQLTWVVCWIRGAWLIKRGLCWIWGVALL